MKNIRFKSQPEPYEDPFYHSEDVDRIVKAMVLAGFNCPADMARALWEKYSDSMCAGWLFLPESDDDIVASLRPYFEEDV